MSTIETLAVVQAQETRDSELSALSREELEAEIARLRHRESLFAATEAVAHIGHYEWNYEFDRLESCSEEYAMIFDMTITEVMHSQDSWAKTLEQIHPGDRERYKTESEAMRTNDTLDVEYRILLESGAVKHIREMGVVVFDNNNQPIGTFGILQDISRQVDHEREMEQRDEFARQAESITDIGHFVFDEAEERYTYMSDGFARIYGYSVKDYMQRMQSVADDLSDIIEEDRARVAEEYRYYVETGHDCAVEYRIHRTDGTIRWIRELGMAKESADGRVTKTLGVVQDITERVNHEQELTFREALANQAEALTDIGYFLYDTQNNQHLFASAGQARIVGIGVEKFRSKVISYEDYLEYLHPDDREPVLQTYLNLSVEQPDWEVEYRVLRPDGEQRWIRETGRVHKISDGTIEQTIGVLQDITGQKKIEQELLYKDALANQAEAITEGGHYIYDEIAEEYLFVSPGLLRIHGREEAQLLNVKTYEGDLELIHADDRDSVQKAYNKFLAGGEEMQVEYRLLRGDGEYRWVRESIRAHLIDHGIPEQTIGVLQDITRQKNAEQDIVEAKDNLEQQIVARTRELANTVKQLQQEVKEREKIAAELDFLANHDALTGLPSLRLCKDRLEQSLAEARRNRQMSAVMFLDLDGFKEVNDSHGHELGDKVLKVTAERIKAEIRETDTVARIGGDEFVIILSSLPELSISERIAASIIEQITRPIQIDEISASISASIGISLYPEDGTTAEELIREADRAMYRIKAQGKNNYGFVHSLNF